MSYDPYKTYDAAELRGKTVTAISREGDDIKIVTDDGTYVISHHQSCCESVTLKDVQGDLQSLVGSPLILATEARITDMAEWPADLEKPEYLDSWTISVYHFATATASVRLRWLGESNGYYGETVDIDRIA